MVGDQDVLLPTAFDDLDIGIVLRDPETGAMLDVNSQIERLYGYSRSELLEMNIADYTAPSTKFSQDEAMRRIRAAVDEPQVFEWQIKRASGELIWIRIRLNKTAIDSTTCVIAEIRDITEYKARERRLRLLNRVVRHNLRNETNVLMGYADRLQRAVEEKTLEEEVEMILEIATEIGSLSDSIQQIEEIAKPDATDRSPTNLGTLVQEVITEIRDEYPPAELTVDIQADIWVNADQGLRHAITHAIENAIVHNDQDAPSVEVRLSSASETGQGEIRIVDDGPIIPDVETAVLKNEITASTTYHGSGVGLWVMQWCVDSLGGELRFEENVSGGNTVRFLLPQANSSLVS
ncbi:PAS domain S-box protein [Natrinema halophilum]|uniref:histidine kinase n=1 Tax=Natrinema halophilum TaxID=1699371 RepID=A0A7D5GQZ7_9EURY|nr:PAS domain-containing sensor histidine kinase [Natrinema halophilum]QLG47786.1 PAS domain-containing sensor histidine kinase [Natrinema halophilum]